LSDFATVPVRSEAEIERVAALAREIWTEHYTAIIGTAQVEYMLATVQSPASIARQIREGIQYSLIISEAEDAGYFAVRPDRESQSLFLSKLYIRREMRGRKLAARALAWMTVRALELDLKSMWLTVNKRNSAVLAYKRAGFFVTREVVTDIGAGYVMDDYVMERPVDLDS